MDHSYIEEHNIADLYLMGKLEAQESARFELHFINCRSCTDLLEETQSFRQALKSEMPRDTVISGVGARTGLFRWMAQLATWKSATVLAGLLILLVILPAVLFSYEILRLRRELSQAKTISSAKSAQSQNPPESTDPSSATTEPSSEIKDPAPPEQAREPRVSSGRKEPIDSKRNAQSPKVNVPIFVLSAIRGIMTGSPDQTNVIVTERSSEWFVISLELEGDPEYETYRATISSPDNRAIWSNATLRPNRYDALTMRFDSGFFREGNYILSLEGIIEEGRFVPIANYSFRIIQKKS